MHIVEFFVAGIRMFCLHVLACILTFNHWVHQVVAAACVLSGAQLPCMHLQEELLSRYVPAAASTSGLSQ
jgi:hypothetical protein